MATVITRAMASMGLRSTSPRSAVESYDNEEKEKLESKKRKLVEKKQEEERIQAEIEKLNEKKLTVTKELDKIVANQSSGDVHKQLEKFKRKDTFQKKIDTKVSKGEAVSSEIENIKEEIRNIEMKLWNQLNQHVGNFGVSRVTATMPSSSTEQGSKYRTPLNVRKWDTFENLFVNESEAFKRKILTEKLNFTSRQDTLDRISSNEAKISDVFKFFLRTLLIATEEVYRVHFLPNPEVIDSVGLRPDLTMTWHIGDTTLCFPIEMKRPTTLTPMDDNDLAKEATRTDKYSLKAHDLHPVNQIFTYSCTMRSRYAVLSTFEKTWFAERIGDDISFTRAFKNDETGMSLARAWAVFLGLVATQESEEAITEEGKKYMEIRANKINKATTKDNSGNTTAREEGATSSSVTTNRAYRGQRSRGDLSDLPLDDIAAAHNPTEVFHGLNHGIAIRNDLHGYDSVVKIVDAPQDREGHDLLEHEASIYTKLRGLWGKYMPGMVFAGPLTLARTALAVTYEGTSLNRLKDLTGLGMSKEDLKQKACEALAKVHEAGVLHGDLALRNMVVDPQRKSLKLIDFGSAREVQPGAEDEQRMRLEMEQVSQLFERE